MLDVSLVIISLYIYIYDVLFFYNILYDMICLIIYTM